MEDVCMDFELCIKAHNLVFGCLIIKHQTWTNGQSQCYLSSDGVILEEYRPESLLSLSVNVHPYVD